MNTPAAIRIATRCKVFISSSSSTRETHEQGWCLWIYTCARSRLLEETGHGREREEDRAQDDPLRPLRADREGQGRHDRRRDGELGDPGVVRAAAGGRRREGGFARARPHQGIEGLRPERARQGPTGDG